MNQEWQQYNKKEISDFFKSQFKEQLSLNFIRYGFNKQLLDTLKYILVVPLAGLEQCVNDKNIGNFNSGVKKLKKAIFNFQLIKYFLFLGLIFRVIFFFVLFFFLSYFTNSISLIKNSDLLNSFTGNSIFLLFTMITGFFLKEDGALLFDFQKFITNYKKELNFLSYKITTIQK